MKTVFVREKTRNLVEFLATPFLKFSPNSISFLSLLMSILAVFFLYKELYYFSSLFILFNGLLDVIDGAVARKTNKASNFGKFFDRTIDKLSDVITISSFIVLELVDLKLGIYVLTMTLIATNLSANIEAVLNFKISDAVSMRFLRILIFIVFVPFEQFNLIFILIALISTYSFLYRFFKAWQISKQSH